MSLITSPISQSDIPEKSESGDKLITTNDIATAVRSTFINKTAINKATYPDIYGTLLSYTEGIPTIVEYFRKRENYINRQTIDTSMSGERSSVQFSFDNIKNFEIRLKEPIDPNIDSEATEVTINGSAIIYPGFKPNVGDIFYFKLIDNRIGAFVVNMTQPLSIAHGTHYQCEFHFDQFITEDYDDRLRAAVSGIYYFDRQKYFSDEAALLTASSYKQYEDLVKLRKAIISLVMNQFYHQGEQTIIAPSNVFDTYLIEYFKNKIGINDSRRRLCQIPNQFTSKFDNTIWYAFLNQDISVLMYIAHTLISYKQFIFDASTSNIDLFRLVALVSEYVTFDPERVLFLKFYEEDDVPRTVSYIFSNRFYFFLIRSFELGTALTSFDDNDAFYHFLNDMSADTRFYENVSDQFFCVTTNSYQDLSYFDNHSQLTGSNNNIHLPEIEYLMYDFIVNDNIDINYLLSEVVPKFPFNKMNGQDRLYYSAILLHLADISIQRLR